MHGPATQNAPQAPAPKEPALEAGDEVGEYRIVRALGSGGFGTVYEGLQPMIKKRVAIKLLSRRHSSDSDGVSRFLDEARIANELGHKNIVGTFSFGQLEDGRRYHVMEYVEGRPLDAMIASEGGVATEDALEILRGVAAALDAAHERGIVHRDLKPANVLVSREDGVAVAKVIDFGIAKLLEENEARAKTESGAILGTPEYMAPEQCRGREVDARADAYAFGVLSYELLTGKRPFEGDDRVDLFLKHTAETPAAPSERRAELPRAVDAIVLGLLAKDPEARPAGLSDTVRALGQALRDSSPPLEQRRTVWPWLVGFAALAVAVGWAVRPSSSEVGALPAPAAPTSPPAPSAAQPAPDPPVPAPRAKLELRGTPSGAEVVSPDGAVLGTVPGVIELSGPSVLTFRKRGFVSEKRDVQSGKDQVIDIHLAKPRARPAPGPDDPEDPFR